MTEQALVLVTTGGTDEAHTIARRLVEARLAAGVQMVPIESIYHWRGEVVEDDEVLLIVKTRADRFDAIESMVRSLHSYDVAPILLVTIDEGHRPYLDWIDRETVGSPGES